MESGIVGIPLSLGLVSVVLTRLLSSAAKITSEISASWSKEVEEEFKKSLSADYELKIREKVKAEVWVQASAEARAEFKLKLEAQ